MREALTRGRDWASLAASAAAGTFSAHDDSEDPDVRAVATLFAGSEYEEWASPAAPKDREGAGRGHAAPAAAV